MSFQEFPRDILVAGFCCNPSKTVIRNNNIINAQLYTKIMH